VSSLLAGPGRHRRRSCSTTRRLWWSAAKLALAGVPSASWWTRATTRSAVSPRSSPRKQKPRRKQAVHSAHRWDMAPPAGSFLTRGGLGGLCRYIRIGVPPARVSRPLASCCLGPPLVLWVTWRTVRTCQLGSWSPDHPRALIGPGPPHAQWCRSALRRHPRTRTPRGVRGRHVWRPSLHRPYRSNQPRGPGPPFPREGVRRRHVPPPWWERGWPCHVPLAHGPSPGSSPTTALTAGR
jgi:hypothetical protein